MPLLKMIFFAGLVLLGGIAVFIGGIVMLTSLQSGAIVLTSGPSGSEVTETITRAADESRFWRLYAVLGVTPLVVGGAVLWWGVRAFRQ
jgi:hypothetical protein